MAKKNTGIPAKKEIITKEQFDERMKGLTGQALERVIRAYKSLYYQDNNKMILIER